MTIWDYVIGATVFAALVGVAVLLFLSAGEG